MLCMGEISPQLADNEAWVDQTFEKCDDILHRQVYLGQGRQEGLLVYVEVAVSNLMLEEHVIGLSDVQPLKSYEEGKAALLAGNGLLFLDGDTNCYKISSKGYPGLGVKKAENEKVIRGSQEAFTESEKAASGLPDESGRTDSGRAIAYYDSTGLYGRSDLSGAVDYYEAAVAAV